MWSDWGKELNTSHGKIFNLNGWTMIKHNKKNIGMFNCYPTELEDTIYIVGFYLKPEFRQSKIGTAVLNEIKNKMHKNTYLILTAELNTAYFYLTNGFEPYSWFHNECGIKECWLVYPPTELTKEKENVKLKGDIIAEKNNKTDRKIQRRD